MNHLKRLLRTDDMGILRLEELSRTDDPLTLISRIGSDYRTETSSKGMEKAHQASEIFRATVPNIHAVGVFGSTQRGTSYEINSSDAYVHADVDMLIAIGHETEMQKRATLKQIFLGAKHANEQGAHSIDIVVMDTDQVNSSIRSSTLDTVFYHEMIGGTRFFYESAAFEDLRSELSRTVESNAELVSFADMYRKAGIRWGAHKQETHRRIMCALFSQIPYSQDHPSTEIFKTPQL